MDRGPDRRPQSEPGNDTDEKESKYLNELSIGRFTDDPRSATRSTVPASSLGPYFGSGTGEPEITVPCHCRHRVTTGLAAHPPTCVPHHVLFRWTTGVRLWVSPLAHLEPRLTRSVTPPDVSPRLRLYTDRTSVVPSRTPLLRSLRSLCPGTPEESRPCPRVGPPDRRRSSLSSHDGATSDSGLSLVPTGTYPWPSSRYPGYRR